MTTRSIKAVLELDSNQYVAGMRNSTRATREFATAARGDFDKTRSGFDGMGASVAGGGKYVAGLSRAKAATSDLTQSMLHSTGEQRAAWDDLGNGALIAGGAIAGGLGLATREAINWESAWAGVTKTTEGSDAQMAQLEQQLRGLTKVLPATHEEIAGVAESAGQLGIAREDLVGFTETAIALGESTNLSADEAATGLAKIANVMGTLDDEGVVGIERMGSALVALGNDGASTESDILSMAQRLSGAGDLIGATESDILAMSSALSSVGIEAELGGGAMSRGLQLMNTAVIEGDEKLQKFADTAGMTAQEFATAWRENPVAAANEFIAGLGRVSDSGGDAAEVLNDVGLSGTQNAQVFLRAAGASDLLTEQLKLGEDAYRQNTAAREEATKRYETDASKLKIAQNGVRDAAIDMGAAMAPIAANIAGYVAGAADTFVKLPGPVKDATTVVAGFTAATLLAGGAATKATTSVLSFTASMQAAGVTGATAAGVLTTLGKALAVVGVAWGASEADEWIKTQRVAGVTAQEMTAGLVELGKGGDTAAAGLNELYHRGGEWYQIFGDGDEPLTAAEALDRFALSAQNAFGDSLNDKLGRWTSLSDEAKVFGEEVATLDAALVDMVNNGNADQAAAAFERMMSGVDPAIVDQVKAGFVGYNDTLASTSTAADGAGDSTAGLAGDLDTVEGAAADAASKVEDLAKAIRSLGSGFRDERSAARDMRDAIRGIGEVAGKSADEQEAAFDDAAQASLDYIATLAESGASEDELAAATRRARSAYIDKISAVTGNRDAAKALADAQGLVVSDVVSEYRMSGAAEATQKTKDLKAAQDLIKPQITTSVSVPGAKDARSQTQAFYDSLVRLPPTKQTSVGAPGAPDARSKTQAFYDSLVRLPGSKSTSVSAPGAPGAKGQADAFYGSTARLPGSKSTAISAPGAPGAKGQVDAVTGAVLRVPSSKSVTVTANTSAAIAALAGVSAYMAGIQSKTVTVTTQRRTVGGRADGGIDLFDGGRHVQAFADGGTWDPNRPWDTTLGRMQPGIKPVTQRGILMAEEGAGPWEAFISGHPGKVDRSKTIASDVVRMLGGQVSWNPDERLIAAMASGGVYGDWQAELRNVKRLDRKYPLRINKDGTARWTGSREAPADVAAAIARLNAAQERYEDAKGDGSGRGTKRSKPRMLGPEMGGGDGIGLPKLGSYRYPGRGNSGRSVSSSPYFQGSTSAGGGRVVAAPVAGGGGGVDTAAITRAMTQAMAGWRPMVRLGDRELYGVMQRVTDKQKGR